MGKTADRFLLFVFDLFQRRFERGDAPRAERMGERIGLLAYRFDRKHRERAISNLKFAFPEHDGAWAENTARESFRHFGRILGDFLRAPARPRDEVLASIDADPDITAALESVRNTGALLVTAHFGNWERASQWVVANGFKLSVVARDADQAGIQDRVLRIRQSAGVDVLSRGDAALSMMRKLRKKEIVGMLPDQNAGDAFVPFFGHPVGTVLGPAVMALRTRTKIVSLYCYRTGPGRYRLILQDVIDPTVENLDPTKTMERINKGLEAAIRLAPEQYLWMHDRWKSARRRKAE